MGRRRVAPLGQGRLTLPGVPDDDSKSARGALHHIEVWVIDIDVARAEWGWLLAELGYRETDAWATGQSWQRSETYFVLEAGPSVTAGHDRMRAGVNHLAFHGGSRDEVERLSRAAADHGWSLLFPDRHPHAGGATHFAAYLESRSGFEVELVAR